MQLTCRTLTHTAAVPRQGWEEWPCASALATCAPSLAADYASSNSWLLLCLLSFHCQFCQFARVPLYNNHHHHCRHYHVIEIGCAAAMIQLNHILIRQISTLALTLKWSKWELSHCFKWCKSQAISCESFYAITDYCDRISANFVHTHASVCSVKRMTTNDGPLLIDPAIELRPVEPSIPSLKISLQSTSA